MYNQNNNMMRNAAMGLLAGGAIGALGIYVAQKNPREMKRMMKKASRNAEKMMQKLDQFMG